MADIHIERKHGRPASEVKQIVEHVAEELSRKLNIDYRYRGDALEFRRSGIDGTISFDDENIVFDAKLGLLLKALRPKLEAAVHQKLDEYIV